MYKLFKLVICVNQQQPSADKTILLAVAFSYVLICYGYVPPR